MTATLLEVVERRPGAGQRLPDHGRDELQMPPRRDLGDDAAEPGVQLVLGRDDARQDLAVGRDQRGSGLVARRLDPENERGYASRHMISASSRLSV